MADLGKKGFTDLSSMFSQKTNLYEDPNESLMGNGHGSSIASSSSFSNSYQTQDTDQFRDSSPSGYGSGLTHNPISSESKAQMNSSSPSASRTKSSKKNSSVTTTTSFVSREEKTLLDLEAEFNPSKNKAKKKTLEDEFWAELEK